MTAARRAYRRRLADDLLDDLLLDFPVVMITGPRAASKTTTAAMRAEQFDRLDVPGVAAAYHADPDAAIARAARPLLIDEWHEVPESLAAVKRAVDANPAPGQFLLTGGVLADLGNEMWAGTGRVVRMSMFSLTERELLPSPVESGPSLLSMAMEKYPVVAR